MKTPAWYDRDRIDELIELVAEVYRSSQVPMSMNALPPGMHEPLVKIKQFADIFGYVTKADAAQALKAALQVK